MTEKTRMIQHEGKWVIKDAKPTTKEAELDCFMAVDMPGPTASEPPTLPTDEVPIALWQMVQPALIEINDPFFSSEQAKLIVRQSILNIALEAYRLGMIEGQESAKAESGLLADSIEAVAQQKQNALITSTIAACMDSLEQKDMWMDIRALADVWKRSNLKMHLDGDVIHYTLTSREEEEEV